MLVAIFLISVGVIFLLNISGRHEAEELRNFEAYQEYEEIRQENYNRQRKHMMDSRREEIRLRREEEMKDPLLKLCEKYVAEEENGIL